MDSQHLYFVLWAGPWAGYSDQPQEQTYGLWRADIHSGAVEEITPFIKIDDYPVAVSPDGWAVLVGGCTTPFALIDVQTKTVLRLDLPPGARIVAWRTPGTR